jgi:hypothetical protein
MVIWHRCRSRDRRPGLPPHLQSEQILILAKRTINNKKYSTDLEWNILLTSHGTESLIVVKYCTIPLLGMPFVTVVDR